jgi:D-alanyl-lipoteichoic acid acyltransferase DltB (MBOAT superfamily)
LVIVYIVYRCVSHRLQNVLLLVASYIFYAWLDVSLLSLIVFSTVVNYCCTLVIRNGSLTRKELRTASIWTILASFSIIVSQWKYFYFSSGTFSLATGLDTFTLNKGGWLFFAGACAITLSFNLVHPKIARLSEEKRRVLFSTISIIGNLGILGFFKYYNFFVNNIDAFLRAVHLQPAALHMNIILPIGVSFYTFKGISYTVDVYRGDIEPSSRYLEFALFISFFPALLAGPIDRAGKLLPQFQETRRLSIEQTIEGVQLFLYGLFKKTVIADGVIRTVSSVYGSSGRVSWIDIIVATVMFTLQIYCDFSGYTDMARGTARLFGFDLMENFKLPYFSENPREFWSRWHISLSSWLRDYLYIPLGGNRDGSVKTYRNLIITMALGGLWHGAAWNFVLWGFFHGIILCVHRIAAAIRSVGEIPQKFYLKWAKTAIFFMITCYGWMLFRATSLGQIASLTSTLITDFGNIDFGAIRPNTAALFGLPIFLIIEFIEYKMDGKKFYQALPLPAWTAVYASIIFVLILGMNSESSQFIYFNF